MKEMILNEDVLPTHFRCPVCAKPLGRTERTAICPDGHSFDRAAQGYVNLLLPDKKHSKNPGDGKLMVTARTAFLNGGYYAPLAEAVGELCASLSPDTILDAGCGEGYYLTHVAAKCPDAALIGVDLSKDAVRTAARRLKSGEFAVANCFDLPLVDGTADVLLQIFSPAADAEYCRVLKNGGRLLSVTPGKEHLFGLKKILYENPYFNDEEEEAQWPSFQIVKRERIAYPITVDGNDMIENLFRMTPYFWRTEGKGGSLDGVKRLETPVDFIITLYEKK